MVFWQWVGLAVAAAVLCMVVRTQQPQMAGLCALAAGLMLLCSALESAAEVQKVFARLAVLGGLREGYLSTLIKVLGMSYASELAAQTCEDLGEGGLALKVALLGKLCVFSLTAPMLLSLLEMILELVP
ncbi:MAG: stage III sporulation AC/AD family protein [Clostridia bacterium]